LNKNIKYSVGGLFSGVGGFELGFSKAGFDTKWAIENDPDAAKTYRHNFSNHILIEKDVKKITSKEIKSLPDVDVLLAGFPCQAFSIAGYRKGFKDPRGNLFDEIIRFVEELQKKPKVLVLENVRNFFGHDNTKTWKYVSQAIGAHNYSQVPMILNTSSSTGIPQNRERAYIVCFNNEAKVEYEIQKLNNKKNIAHSELDYYEGTKSSQFLSHLKKNLLTERKTLDKFLENNVQDKKYLYTKGKFNTRSAKDGLLIFEELKRSMKDSQTVYQWRRVGEVRANKKGEVPTLTASMGAGGHNVPLILDGKNIRKLTPRECFNFQGFPKSFKLPKKMADNQLYKQAGNAVTVPLVKKIAVAIKKTLED
jgi:DNA (cytosine-5)-methyltransferase 1